MRTYLLTAALVAPLSGHALAFDPGSAGRYPSPDLYRPNVDRIIINGSGSTGSADLFSVTPQGLPSIATRTFRDKLADMPINVNDYKYLIQDGDATAAVQAAIDAGLAQNRPVRCDGTYHVRHVVVSGQGSRLAGTCNLVGNASSRQPSVLEVQRGVFMVEGSLNVSADYNLNYDSAILWTTNTQSSHISNLSASAAKVCYTIGSTDKPRALLSEVTILGGHTYGCTQVAKFISIEAVVTIIGAQWSSDAFGAPSERWAGVPFRGITSVGADVNMFGGELIMTVITDGVLIDNQPIAGPDPTEGTYYSRMRFRGVTMETASPLAQTSNPQNLPIAAKSGQRGLLQFDGISGFHSQDLAPFITTTADFDGEIIWSNSRMHHGSSTRSHPNISAGSSKTDVYVDDRGFGTGFRGPLEGTVGGNPHYGYRAVTAASTLNGQAIGVGSTTLKFADLDPGDDRYAFVNSYNSSTGEFTVPPSGLKHIHIEGTLQLGGTGTLYVNRNDGGRVGQAAASPYSGGAASISYDAFNVPGGTKFSLLIGTSTATAAGSPDFLNTFRISAQN